jgi:hypothetical protein
LIDFSQFSDVGIICAGRQHALLLFIVVCMCTLIGFVQVSMAVLLDNFVCASAEMEQEKEYLSNLKRKEACTVSSSHYKDKVSRLEFPAHHSRLILTFSFDIENCEILVFHFQSEVRVCPQARNPLDPFLSKLCQEYSDDQNLAFMLGKYFQVVDAKYNRARL